MKVAVVVFPGSNCDRDLAVAFRSAGADVSSVWHKDTEVPRGVDLIGLPGGFSFGDYLRCGAIAARAPICAAVARHAARGGQVLGICNGFQILTEMGLLPGALMRNAGLRYVCRTVPLVVAGRGPFTAGYAAGQEIHLPVAHHDGNYQAGPADLDRLEGDGRIAFRYAQDGAGPNGSARAIAGITSIDGRILGMMPHPERACDAATGGTGGSPLFRGLVEAASSVTA